MKEKQQQANKQTNKKVRKMVGYKKGKKTSTVYHNPTAQESTVGVPIDIILSTSAHTHDMIGARLHYSTISLEK